MDLPTLLFQGFVGSVLEFSYNNNYWSSEHQSKLPNDVENLNRLTLTTPVIDLRSWKISAGGGGGGGRDFTDNIT